MPRLSLQLVFLLALSSALSLHALPVRLKQAKAAFQKNDCKAVIQLVGNRDLSREMEDESQFTEAYRLLAICYFRSGLSLEAERELKNLLFIKPNYELDGFSTPPPLLNTFQELKKQTLEKSKELEKAKEKASDKPLMTEKETVYRRNSITLRFLPFGLSQFENSQTTKGALLAAAQTSFLGANVGLYWWKRSMMPTSPYNLSNYNLAQNLQFVALGAFLGAYLYGVVDAFLNQPPIVKEQETIHPIEQATDEFLKQLEQAPKEST